MSEIYFNFSCGICEREISVHPDKHPITGRLFIAGEKTYRTVLCEECRKRLKALLYDRTEQGGEE